MPDAIGRRIQFQVNGLPKGQPRTRAFSRDGRARVYDPGTAEAWKGAIALAAKPFLDTSPIEGPIRFVIGHIMPRPKAHFRTGKRSGELKPAAPRHHTKTPDTDNLAKAAMDALTHIGLWRDDAQVVELVSTKQYGDRAGAAILIEEITSG